MRKIVPLAVSVGALLGVVGTSDAHASSSSSTYVAWAQEGAAMLGMLALTVGWAVYQETWARWRRGR